MNLHFDTSLAQGYKSGSQIARILTEDWLARNMYCPICGEVSIKRAEPNAPVKDYICDNCKAQYELKSKREHSDKYFKKVSDGVYRTMIDRITSLDNPSFFFMHYGPPLPDSARRAGWEGCNILLKQIPEFAKIPIIRNGIVIDPQDVCKEYKRVYALQTNSIESRGWLMDILACVERLDTTFTLKQMYEFVEELSVKHPGNNNVEAKIRQQLQFLRDKGFIEFTTRGNYKKIGL